MKKQRVTKHLLAMLLSAILIVTLLPVAGFAQKVSADTNRNQMGSWLATEGIQLPDDEDWNKTVFGLSTTGISDPRYAGHVAHDWYGSFVWYGKYDGTPVKYRVLSTNTSKYGENTMFLDCDSILYKAQFNPNYSGSNVNTWEGSALQKGLNGSDFLRKPNGFTATERNAIIYSYAEAHDLKEGHWTQEMFGQFVGIDGDKIFLLDAEEADTSRYCYGYDTTKERSMQQRLKQYQGENAWWWLRSAYLDEDGEGHCIGCITSGGGFWYGGAISQTGVSPAFNVDRSSILFSSQVKPNNDYGVGAEYKLTLIDTDIELILFATGRTPSVSGRMNSEGSLSVQAHYKLSSELVPNYFSFFILDKEYTPGNTNEASILYYKSNAVTGDTVPTLGTTSFTLPSEFDVSEWGKSYYVYLVAEEINDIHETDYASEPVKLSAPQITYVAPQITKQPETITVPVGDVAQFSVEAVGTGTLEYQWQSRKDASSTWSNSGQPGAKTATLQVTSLAGLHNWQFRCIVTQANGRTKTSDPATLKVVPKITMQPKNATAPVGDIAEFTVAANGKATLKYQWQSRKDASSAWSNSGQPGAKTATLKVTSLAGLNGWQFRCVVTDGNNMSWGSNAATLTVVPKITTQPKSTYAAPGTDAKFTVAANGKAPLKYQWQSRKNASSAWSNSGMPGAKTATLTVTSIAGLNGWQFRCVVTDANNNSWGSNAATLFTKLSILTQPKNTTAAAGSTAKFTVAAYGKATLKYQWQSRKNASSAWSNSGQPGAKTATLSVTALAGLNGWQFRCIVTDGDGNPLPSSAATLTVK